jgi:hypothetical protein
MWTHIPRLRLFSSHILPCRWLLLLVVLSIEAWGLCNDDIFFGWDNGIVQWWLYTEPCGLCNDGLFNTGATNFCSHGYIIIASFHESIYFWWLCGHNIVILVAHFIHLMVSIYPLSMMPLLHTIHWFFWYWAYPIANDVFAVTLATKLIYYLVSCDGGPIFRFTFLRYTYTAFVLCFLFYGFAAPNGKITLHGTQISFTLVRSSCLICVLLSGILADKLG